MSGGFDERPVWERDGRDDVPVWGAEKTPPGAPPPVPSGGAVVVPLFDARPLMDLARIGDGRFVALDRDGGLTLFRDGVAGRTTRLRVVRPLGLGPVPGGRVAFVDGGGRILDLSFDDAGDADGGEADAAPIRHAGVIEEADAFAVSPEGALVATASQTRQAISGLFLATETSRTLLDGVDTPTALGFSPDGGLLAVGTRAGTVHVADVSGALASSVLPGDRVGGRVVVAVAGAPGGRWVVAYDSERIALWADGSFVRSVDAGGAITSLAVDSATGRVTAGTALGLVRMLDAQLDARVAEVRPFTGAVRRLLPARGRTGLVCAGERGEIRELRLP